MIEAILAVLFMFSCIFLGVGATHVFSYIIELIFGRFPDEKSFLGIFLTIVGYLVFVGVMLGSMILLSMIWPGFSSF